MALARGTLVDNRYRVVEPAGRGSFADVYLAEDVRREARRVALKILRCAGDSSNDDEALTHELGVLQKLDHPTLVEVLGHGRLGRAGPPFLALEWVEGTDLLEAARLLPLARFRRLLVQLCRGLHYLHEGGVVHGDLKPSNLRVLRSPDGGDADLQVKILDFGLAHLLDTETGPGRSPRDGGRPEAGLT